ncbi:MAG: MEMO1 family protein [Nitrososphaeraceae archaeon]|nr:MEMO1 family protein [Nitrososphaeraceae archaeon]
MNNSPKRTSVVAGIFYPSEPLELKQLIEQSFRDLNFGPGRMPPSGSKRRIYGIVSPHAGYVYSGAVAANGYYEISSIDFDNVVMIGPNHYGIGAGVAIMHNGLWETPLGQIEINPSLASEISRYSGIVDFDDFAHSRDHCLEVQIPFLQYIKRNEFKIIPIVLILQDRETAINIGKSIAQTTANSKTLLIASSDFTHYESNSEAYRKDGELIKAILSLDIQKFYSVLERFDVSACGYGAIASTMEAVKDLGATKGELLKYATSGNVTGDMNAVVGYSSIIFV